MAVSRSYQYQQRAGSTDEYQRSTSADFAGGREKKRDERVRRRARLLRTSAPWLDERDTRTSSSATAPWACSSIRLVENARRFGLVNDLGEPRAILDSIRRLAGTLLSFDRELCLTPLSSTGVHTRPIDIFEIAGSVPPMTRKSCRPQNPRRKPNEIERFTARNARASAAAKSVRENGADSTEQAGQRRMTFIEKIQDAIVAGSDRRAIKIEDDRPSLTPQQSRERCTTCRIQDAAQASR